MVRPGTEPPGRRSRLAGAACTRARFGYGLGEGLRIAKGAQRFIEVIYRDDGPAENVVADTRHAQL
jgi:hypothetical protein